MTKGKDKIPPTLDIDELQVKDLMTEDVITVSIPGDRRDALKTMVSKHISGILVVKKGSEELVGIITRKDIFNNPHEEQLALIMSDDPITIDPEASIRECIETFVEYGIHRLPVIGEDGMLKGIITPCDLMRTIEMSKLKTHVKVFSEQFCYPIHEGSPVLLALHAMKINRNYAFPVLNSSLEVVGIITDRDIFEKTTIDSDIVESSIGMSEEEDEWSWEGLRTFAKMFYNLNKIDVPKVKVSDLMVKNVKYLFEETGVSTAAGLMKKNDYDQLPLTDVNDRLTGIVTSHGILKALLNGD